MFFLTYQRKVKRALASRVAPAWNHPTPTPVRKCRGKRIPTKHFIRRYLPALILVLLVGCIISAYHPVVGVPLTLFTMPAMLRGSRIYWRRRQADQGVDAADWIALVLVSVFMVIPVSLVGLATFCCVCTPVGYVGFSIAYREGEGSLGSTLVFTAIYLGMAAGLLASCFLLKRLHYLSGEEAQALERPASTPDEPDGGESG